MPEVKPEAINDIVNEMEEAPLLFQIIMDPSITLFKVINASLGQGDLSRDWDVGLALTGPFIGKFADVFKAADDVAIETFSKYIKFGQSLIGEKFTSPKKSNFRYAGWKVEDVARGLTSGSISPDEIPVRIIIREGNAHAINNRSLAALRMADMQPTRIIDITGDVYYEPVLTDRLHQAAELNVNLSEIPHIRRR